MLQTKLTRLVLVVSLVSAVACFLRLDVATAGSQNKARTSSPTGYHTPTRTPRGASVSRPKPPVVSDSAALLKKSLGEIRAGNLAAAANSLTRLTALAPGNDGYKALLDKTKAQLEFENWYRFQQKADSADVPEVSQAMDQPPGTTPEAAREKFLIWVNSCKWDKR